MFHYFLNTTIKNIAEFVNGVYLYIFILTKSVQLRTIDIVVRI